MPYGTKQGIFLALLGYGVLSMTTVFAGETLSFSAFIDALKKQPPVYVKRFSGSGMNAPYAVNVNNASIFPLLKNVYSKNDIAAIAKATEKARRIEITKRPWGSFVQAASFASDDMGESTNYDAIWVRDSIWGYLALNSSADTAPAAHDILLTLWDYFSSPAQRGRMKDAIADPSLLQGADGQMRAVHIRFNSQSRDFADVEEDGKPQPWTHKQNDALGLLLDATLKAVDAGSVGVGDMKKNGRLETMAQMVAYLDAIGFYAMEDSGAWEEAARLNTSSVALVTGAFEGLVKALAKGDSDFARAYVEAASGLGLEKIASPEYLAFPIEQGYQRIRRQLELGGESPDYDRSDSRYRESDAALLNLIYPATLDGLDLRDKYRIMKQVEPLVGEFGIRRYMNDDYQSANFWFNDIKTDTDESSIEERKKRFIAGSEAQWFFDSWYAKAWLMLYRESGDKADLAKAVWFANRSFGQITGADMLGADGRKAAEFSLPESYNFVVAEGVMWPAASPINPLNWSKASMTIMLKEFETQ